MACGKYRFNKNTFGDINGICGSCKCKVRKGSVSSTSLETLTPEEIEQGYVLACSSTIESDLEVQIG
ncbi:2Fe-2S iron-sulfur cluster-binding protein [Vibrio campbellii]|uniref:2Fe-2S iron-sulfur cluster-binding protein n=1 Tax=Vibrio campbellii TaxID=680 RepID=UPI0039E19AEC